eukprot:GILJ01002443.1.p2 GENE.GILJ01002443.1~~GILJ01002443.1.p2  ORF type:complete len:218 (-),score=27.92 GILJ01002443.1:1076-1729(-)
MLQAFRLHVPSPFALLRRWQPVSHTRWFNTFVRPAVNDEISAEQIRVVSDDGAVGVLSREEALAMAERKSMDLVMVTSEANPPVVRLVPDASKYVANMRYKFQDAVKKKKATQLGEKEIRFGPNISKHDFDTKMRNVHRLLQENNAVSCRLEYPPESSKQGSDVLLASILKAAHDWIAPAKIPTFKPTDPVILRLVPASGVAKVKEFKPRAMQTKPS